MKRKRSLNRFLCIIILFFFGGISQNGYAQSFDPNTWYRLTSQWQGEGKSMGITKPNNYYQGVQLSNSADADYQAWKIRPIGDGYFQLICKYTGDVNCLSLYKSLPKFSYGAIAPWKRTPDQYWKITDLQNGYYHLTVWSKTTDSSLTVMNDGKTNDLLILKATGNYSNQNWMIKPFYQKVENNGTVIDARPNNQNNQGTRETKSAYGRGGGYPWKLGDKPFSLDAARQRCESENSQGCEKYGEMYYPKCKAGYHATGCCICSPN